MLEKYLSINEFSRPGKYLKKVLGIILHWTGPNGHNANQVWDYFQKDCPVKKHYSSAHYIIDFNGDVIQSIPNNEMAYHCGSRDIDPKSLRFYTDWARSKFGYFATSPNCSPNQVTIGIELCSMNSKGEFKNETIWSAIDLVTYLLFTFNLTIDDIGTHNMVVGWKDCPKLWVNKPILFDAFKNDVKLRLANGHNKATT